MRRLRVGNMSNLVDAYVEDQISVKMYTMQKLLKSLQSRFDPLP
jgi:hypothetical protein